MVEITIQNELRARITGLALDEEKRLDDLLSFRKSKFWFKSPQAQGGMWDGKTHMFHRNSSTFPLGLLPDVRKWFKRNGIKRKIVDNRTSEPLPWKLVTELGGGIKLRKDQVRAVEKALSKERGIIHGCTGSGKTECAVAMIESYGRPITLFFTGRKKLARQTRERFALRMNVPLTAIGFIQGGKWEESTVNVYVAVVDTLVQKKFANQRRELYKKCELLFVDECHHAGSTKWYGTLIHCKARHRFGLTGTPVGRSDGGDLYLRAATGKIVAKISATSLIDKGILAEPTIIFTKVKRPHIVAIDEPWSYIYKNAIVENFRRNSMITRYVEGLRKLNKKTLVLVREKEHGRLLEETLIDAKFLHSGYLDEQIDEAVRDFESGELSTIIATSIFDEGVDIPTINALVNAAGGKSIITTLQRIGRGLRRKKDDNRLFVFDFLDLTNEHLEKHARQRIDVCKSEGFKVKILGEPKSVQKLIKKVV